MKIVGLLLCLSSLLPAQILHVQSAGKASARSIAFTPKAAGDLLVVFGGCSNVVNLTVADSAGNAWKTLNPAASQSGEGTAQSWYAFSKGITSTTITVSGCGSWADVMVDEFSGVNTTVPVDINVQQAGSGNISQALTLSQPNELVWVGALGTLNSAGTGFTIGGNDNSEDLTEYQIATGTTTTASFPNSGTYIALMASFFPNGNQPVQPPAIASFTANPASITSGSSSTLSWSTAGATTVSLSGIGNVNPSDSVMVQPTSTTTYTLTASNSGGTVTSQVTVTVQPAAPPPPNTVTLTAGAIGCTLTNNAGSLSANCSANGSPLYSGSVAQSVSPGFVFSLTLSTDSLTVILKPDGSGGWSWSAASNDSPSNGTL